MTTERPLLAFALMDAPFESARTTTALRLLDAAARRGCDLKVFAYEGAVLLPFARQHAHPNAVHGRSAEEENHLLPKDIVAALIAKRRITAATSTGSTAGCASMSAALATRSPVCAAARPTTSGRWSRTRATRSSSRPTADRRRKP